MYLKCIKKLYCNLYGVKLVCLQELYLCYVVIVYIYKKLDIIVGNFNIMDIYMCVICFIRLKVFNVLYEKMIVCNIIMYFK